MTKPEKIGLALLAVALVAVVIFNQRGGLASVLSDDIVGMSQSPDDANTIGPAYLVASMPYGYGPPVTMQAPVTTAGMQGQAAPLYDTTCGCK